MPEQLAGQRSILVESQKTLAEHECLSATTLGSRRNVAPRVRSPRRSSKQRRPSMAFQKPHLRTQRGVLQASEPIVVSVGARLSGLL